MRARGGAPAPPRRLPPAPERPRRTIFDAGHRIDRRADRILRREGEPPVADEAANQAYDGFGDTYRLFWEVMGRDSIDGLGHPLLGEVHFGRGYDNAFWDGERLIFGDGDGRLFRIGAFTSSLDVIGHELTHAVIERTIGLRYDGQPGALNESIADVFGALVKQYALGQTVEQADWSIGAGILGPALRGYALRSLSAPGTAFEGDLQPAHVRDYVPTDTDNGGVHLNSGIPNRAFYLVAVALGGYAWERAGRIWYRALVAGELPGDAGFEAFARATVRSAAALFGPRSAEAVAVAEGWAEVGVLRRPMRAMATQTEGGEAGAGRRGSGRLWIERSGGIAGLTLRASISIEELTDRERRAVRRCLAAEAGGSLRHRRRAGGAPPSPAGPDRFVYRLSLGGQEAVVGEDRVRGDLRRLLERLVGGGAPP